MKAFSRVLAIALALTSLISLPASADTRLTDPNAWMEGVTLVVLETDDIASLHAARALVQHEGGTIGVLSPPSLLLGWIPDAAWPNLEGRMGIRSLHRGPVTASEVGLPAAKLDAQTQTILNFYNAVATGELERTLLAQKAPDPETVANMPGDVFTAPPIEPEAFLKNLLAQGYSQDELAELGALDAAQKDNTFVMSGTVAVSLLFPESDGSGTDPNLYDWDYSHYQSYANLAIAGMMWWSLQADILSPCWVAFLPTMYPPTDPRCNTSIEIMTHGSAYVDIMVSELMANFGYTSGGHITRAAAFATNHRITLGAERSYVAFIGYNPPGSGSALNGGMAAWAYYYGPYTFLLWNSFNTAANRVFAHETGHIFGACDEYADGCDCAGGCSPNGVPNNNCEDCGGQTLCVMAYNDLTLCNWTDDHLGWRLAGECQQPALPAPTVTNISPSSGEAGATLDLTVTGTNFVGLPRLSLGSEVVLNEVTYISSTEIVANVTIGNLAAPGLRTATVQNPDLRVGTQANAFEIIPTLYHYVSPAGGNVFPYTTPQDAATSLFDALAVAGPGDVVRLSTMTFTNVNISLLRGVTLEGAWDPAFTQRDLNAKTEIILVQNVRVQECDVTLDGLILRNGSGRSEFLPWPLEARYGGAALVLDGALTVRDCEIYDNTSIVHFLTTAQGGALFAYNSVLNVYDTAFTNNVAYQGGAIFLENSSGTISGNTFAGNSVSVATGVPLGAAVFVNGGSGVVFEDNVFTANTGAQNGGAIYVQNASGTELRGGSIQSHSVTSNGAGVYAVGSDLVVDGVRFESNSAGSLGGGLYAGEDFSLTVRSSEFVSNTALLGAALQTSATPSAVEHSLFTANSSTLAAAAAYFVNVGSGSFVGNVVDGNTAGSGAVVLFANSSLSAFNNLVTSNSGNGLFCSGPSVATLSYNDVWNSSGLDLDGCVPGAGSFSADPLFVDAPGGDYRLGLHSPAIDTGQPDVANLDPDGSRGDLGRYGSHAFVMDQPAFVQNLTAQIVSGDAVLQWDANGEADLASYVVYSSDTAGFAPGLGTFATLVAAGTTTVNLGPPSGTTYYRLAAIDADGYMGGYSNEVTLEDGTPVDTTTPRRWVLHQNIPNPFNPQTIIRYELRERGPVQLTVYDVTGRVVRRLVDGEQDAGPQSVIWDATGDDGSRVASGMYFYELRAGSFVATNKMVVLK